jgi:hypothetical protein
MWRVQLRAAQPQWEPVSQQGEVPPPCCNCPAALAEGSLYIFSGMSGKHTSEKTFRFELQTHTWHGVPTRLPLHGGGRPPARRFGHVMQYDGRGKLWVFGGVSDNTLSNAIYSFDLHSHTWEELLPHTEGPAPSGRCFLAGVIHEWHLYLFGGTVDFARNARSNEMFRFGLTITPPCTLHSDLLALLRGGDLSDATLVTADGSQRRAHCAMLALRSLVLGERLLQQRQTTGQATVTLPLPEVSTGPLLDDLLHFIYGDALPCHVVEPEDEEALLGILELHQCARTFRLKRLEHTCLEAVRDAVKTLSALRVLAAVDSRNLMELRDELLTYCCRDPRYHALVHSLEFERLPKPLIVELVRRRESVLEQQRALPQPPGLTAASPSRSLPASPTRRSSHQLFSIDVPLQVAALQHSLVLDLHRAADAALHRASAGDAADADEAQAMTRGYRSASGASLRARAGSATSDWLPADSAAELAAEFCDLRLCTGDGVRIPVHAALLAARCGFFKGLLSSGEKPSHHGVVVMAPAIIGRPMGRLWCLGMLEVASRLVPLKLGQEAVLDVATSQALLKYIYTGDTGVSPEVRFPPPSWPAGLPRRRVPGLPFDVAVVGVRPERGVSLQCGWLLWLLQRTA